MCECSEPSVAKSDENDYLCIEVDANSIIKGSSSNRIAKLVVKDTTIRTLAQNGIDYICITDIARQKNPVEPKDVIKNWMRVKNTLEYLGLWESLNNPDFKGVEFDPILREAGSNSFTMSPSRWIELTGAIGIINRLGRDGGA